MSIEELGRRAVACKHWRWMPGMYLLPHADGCPCCEDRNFPRKAARLPLVVATDVDVPDLTDPATLGCLLHLVREAWGEQMEVFAYRTEMHDKRWCIERAGSERDPSRAWYGWTEAEALVTALEAAP